QVSTIQSEYYKKYFAESAGASTKHYFVFFLSSALLYLAITLVSNVVFKLIEGRVRRWQPRLA
ncbi:hypothetical protein AB9E34_33125, partial [Rhizobium leguminosarum]